MNLRFLLVALTLLAASPALGQTPFIPPSGTLFDASTATLGAASTQILAAVPNGGKRSALIIQLNTASASVACNPNGAAALNTAGSITITAQGSYINFAGLGAVPNTAINCIADASSRSITVWAYPQ